MFFMRNAKMAILLFVVVFFWHSETWSSETKWDVFRNGDFRVAYPAGKVERNQEQEVFRLTKEDFHLVVYKFTNQPSFRPFANYLAKFYDDSPNMTLEGKEIGDDYADFDIKIRDRKKKYLKAKIRVIPCGKNTAYVVQAASEESIFSKYQEITDRVINSVQCGGVELSKETSTEPPIVSDYKIIFESVRDAPIFDSDYQLNPQKYFELYTMNVDGSNVQRVTNNSIWETQAEVSPDGKKILCSIISPAAIVEDVDSRWEIAIMDIDGGNPKKLTDNDYLDKGPDWNHDGTKIAYISDSAHRTNEDIKKRIPFKLDLYVMNSDGSGKEQLTFAKPGEIYGDPGFSNKKPSKITYAHSQGFSDKTDLYIMDSDGSDKRLVLKHDKKILAATDPEFSPDDSRIIFMGRLNKRGKLGFDIYNIFSINIDGTDLRRITDYDGESDVLPKYSPDGALISYYTYKLEGGLPTHRIRIAKPDGGAEQTISDFLWEAAPSWFLTIPREDKNN